MKKLNLLIKKLNGYKVDALCVFKAENISYLTGFRQAPGNCLLITADKIIYFTDFIYRNEAISFFGAKNQIEVVYTQNNWQQTLKYYAKRLNLKTIGVEESIPLPFYQRLKTIFSFCQINTIPNSVEDLRIIKTAAEIKAIKKAVAITKDAFSYIKEIIDSGSTEKDIFLELERFLCLKGDIRPAFDPIVAFGANTAIPHHISGHNKLGKNSLCLIDCGAKYRGYCADLTRIFFFDKMPPYLKKIYDIVKKAKESAVKKVKSGVKIKTVDKAARDYIAKKGFAKNFGHGLGHGVGLEVHERPFLNPKNEGILKEGMVITIEPAIYLTRRFGIRLEDTILVKKNKAEIL